MVGASGFEPHQEEIAKQVKAAVTLSGCGAFVASGSPMLVPNSPRFHPSIPVKTETVSLLRIVGAGFERSIWKLRGYLTPFPFLSGDRLQKPVMSFLSCNPNPLLKGSLGRQHLRTENFQSSCRSGTMCPYRSLLVSIQAFNGGLSRSILPIRTHSVI